MRAAIVSTILLVGLAGCVSAGETPDWANDSGYPSLREAPRGTSANTDAAYWAAMEADLVSAGEAVRNHPRAEPASATQSPEEFLEEARREIEDARRSHDPN
jgi:hypothetical protein